MLQAAKKKLPRWLLILFVVAGVISTVAVILRILTPTTPDVPLTPTISTNLDGSNTLITGITYAGPTKAFPADAPILQAQGAIGGEEFVQNLISSYQLTKHPQANNVWIGDTHTLTRVEQVNQYVFSSLTEYGQPAAMEDQRSLDTATKLLKEVLPVQDWQALPEELTYFNDDHGEVTDRSEALGVIIPFSYVVEGIPFSSTGTTASLAEAVLTNTYQLQKLAFFTQFVTYGGIRRENLINIDQAVANLNNGQGAVARVFQENFEDIDLESITSGTMTDVKLVYKLDPQTNLAFPFYMFSGNATMNNGVTAQVTLSTPAVATE